MESKVLVAYATSHGSTRAVAEAIAVTLHEQGLTVDLQPARNVRTLAGYAAVVLGAPLYMLHLHRDALRFLAQHEKTLAAGLPLALFAGGPIGKGDEEEWREVRKELDQELAKFPWLKAVSVEVVGGKFDPNGLHFPWNLLPAMRQMPPSDFRDWDAIRSWAKTLAATFQPVIAPSGGESR